MSYHFEFEKNISDQVKQQSSGLLKITTQNVQPEVPVPPKNRKVFPEDEGHYTINLPQGSTAKTKKILAQQRQQAELQRIRAEEGLISYHSNIGRLLHLYKITYQMNALLTTLGLDNQYISFPFRNIFS